MIQQTLDDSNSDESMTTSMDTSYGYEGMVTIGYAKTIACEITRDAELNSLITDDVKSGVNNVTIPKKYKEILNKLQG